MKGKKIVWIIISCIVIILSILIGILEYKKSYFKIPENYISKDEAHYSYIDGSDIDYYVYKDKIIVDEMSYFPADKYSYTSERTVTIYKNLNENEIKNYKNTIKNRKGKIIFHSRK